MNSNSWQYLFNFPSHPLSMPLPKVVPVALRLAIKQFVPQRETSYLMPMRFAQYAPNSAALLSMGRWQVTLPSCSSIFRPSRRSRDVQCSTSGQSGCERARNCADQQQIHFDRRGNMDELKGESDLIYPICPCKALEPSGRAGFKGFVEDGNMAIIGSKPVEYNKI
jgi:hypothetical protein